MNGQRATRRTAQKRIRGFTLIELMVVVALIALVLTMAIPILQASRMTGNEANAVSALRTVTGAQEMYRVRTGSYGTLSDLASIQLIDNTFAVNPRHGYQYNAPVTTPWQYAVGADPSVPGTTGERYFFVDETGVIRFESSAPATAGSPPVR